MIRVASRWRNARSCVTNTDGDPFLEQPILKPIDRGDVEMVGRFIEQQHIGSGHQRPGEQHPSLQSRRERFKRRVGIEVHPSNHRFDLLLHAPGVRMIDTL